MAIYHFHAKVFNRGQGHSAVAAAAYRAGERLVDERTGQVHDYRRKERCDGAEILAPDNAPAWVHDRSALWNACEAAEKRKDSQVCREVEVSIPRDLTNAQGQDLVRGFVREFFCQRGMVADVAFHKLGTENPHAHILLTMRELSPEGFGNKAREWNDRALLEQWREGWATHANRALEQAGIDQRIDHRTLEAQGLTQKPGLHEGKATRAMERRGVETDRGEMILEIEAFNRQEAQALAQGRLQPTPPGQQEQAQKDRAGQQPDPAAEAKEKLAQMQAGDWAVYQSGLQVWQRDTAAVKARGEEQAKALDGAEAQRAAEVAKRPEMADWDERLRAVDGLIRMTTSTQRNARVDRVNAEVGAEAFKKAHPWLMFFHVGTGEYRRLRHEAQEHKAVEGEAGTQLVHFEAERSSAESDRSTMKPLDEAVANERAKMAEVYADVGRLATRQEALTETRTALLAEQANPVAAIAAREAQARQEALEAQQRAQEAREAQAQRQAREAQQALEEAQRKQRSHDRGGGLSR